MRILFRSQVILIAVIAAVAALGGSPALATHTETQTVSATVTPAVLSVIVSPDNVDYGTVELGVQDNLPTPLSFTATNNGSITEDIDIRGADTANWTLVSTVPATDEYRHEASKDGFTTPIILTTSNLSLDTNVATSGTVIVSLRLDAPTDTTTIAQQTAPVTVIAVAP
jgi:hypothetical protein